MAASDKTSNFESYRTYNQLTFGQSGEWFVETLEPPNDISQTCSRPEVLLLETQFFADWERVWPET